MSGDWMREFVHVTEADLKAPWSSIGREALFCAFCRHSFELGDEFRMCFTNDLPKAGGNPFTCRRCFDNYGGIEGLRKRWQELWAEWREYSKEGKFRWWILRTTRRTDG